MAEYDRRCACGHERRKHAHRNDGGDFHVHGGQCTGPGCTCGRFVDAGEPVPAAVTMCKNCGTRPATLTWLGEGSMMDYIHGGGVPWCQHCSAEARLEYARKLAAQIPELEKELEGLP